MSGYVYRNERNGDEVTLPGRSARLDKLANWTLVHDPSPVRFPGVMIDSQEWSDADGQPEQPPEPTLVVVHHPRRKASRTKPTEGAAS